MMIDPRTHDENGHPLPPDYWHGTPGAPGFQWDTRVPLIAPEAWYPGSPGGEDARAIAAAHAIWLETPPLPERRPGAEPDIDWSRFDEHEIPMTGEHLDRTFIDIFPDSGDGPVFVG